MTRRKTISKEGPEERKQKFSTSSPPPATPAQSSVPSTVSGTPLRTHRSSFMHEGHTPPTIHQADLKKVMRAELGDQTWQFPFDRVANVEEILHGGNCCRGRASQVTQISYSVPENVSPSPHPFLTTTLLSPVALLRRSACVANAEAKKVVEAPVNSKKSSRIQVDSRTRSETKVSNILDPSTLAITPIGVHGPTRDLQDVKQELTILVKPLNPCRGETFHGLMKAAWPKRDLGSGRSSVPEARMLNDKFGTLRHHYSFPASHSHGIPTSNDIFLPTEMELKKGVAEFHWNLFSPHQKHIHMAFYKVSPRRKRDAKI